MEQIKNIGDKITKVFKESKNRRMILILIAGLAGIVLILISELIPKKESSDNYEYKSSVFEISEREAVLEKRIEEAVSKIEGAGKTHVVITFESSEEIFYAKNSSDSKGERENETEEEIVVIDSKNGEEPIFLKTNEAKIRGVLIICEGGKNPLVKEKIIEGICALLDIPSNKVSVAEMAQMNKGG